VREVGLQLGHRVHWAPDPCLSTVHELSAVRWSINHDCCRPVSKMSNRGTAGVGGAPSGVRGGGNGGAASIGSRRPADTSRDGGVRVGRQPAGPSSLGLGAAAGRRPVDIAGDDADEADEAAPLKGGNGGGFSAQVQSHRAVIAEQDAVLDGLHESVTRLGHIAGGIRDELTTQSRMVDDIGNRMDDTNDALARVTRQTQQLVRMAGGTRWASAICCLLTVLLVLVLIIVFM